MSRPARYYAVYGSAAGRIELSDSVAPHMEYLARRFPDIVSRGIRHVAHWLRGEIKSDLRRQAPGGVPLPPLARLRGRRISALLRGRIGAVRLNTVTLAAGSAGRKPYQGMINAVGFQNDPLRLTARVGWLSKSAARFGEALQAGWRGAKDSFEHRGGSQPVTSSMRRRFAAKRVILRKGTKSLRTPPRPVFEPVFRSRKDELAKRFVARVELKLRERADHDRAQALRQLSEAAFRFAS